MEMKNTDGSYRFDLEEQAHTARFGDGITRARAALDAGGVANARLALLTANTTECFAQTASERAEIAEVQHRARDIWPGADLRELPYPATL